jgi:hypothetical protein
MTSNPYLHWLKAFPLGVLAVCGLILALPTDCVAGDHHRLEEGLPVEVEDAFATGYRNRELQTVIRYERTDDNENLVYLEPRLEYGIWPNAEIQVAVPVRMGNADRTGSGDIDLSALYNFNHETLFLPALSLEGTVTFPTGKDSDGYDTELKFLATKTIGKTSRLHQLHLNVSWLRNDEREEDERRNRYKAVLGYSSSIAADWIFVADIVREALEEEDAFANLVEAGVRFQYSPLTVLALGVGVGVGEESPDGRITGGFQRSF